ncbi:hypothetical protein ACFIJ5_08580 [Haloimpatiens sp. FM7330]|uniref:hypothetical protein n=1 Tax=Haloimpatiens sp. FM7330 TaxID=3298610 RepID=UPI003633D91C
MKISKINAFRIVNLNYNNNSMKVDDEIFELGGESTLLSLRNGGGKSVMVQILMAPFVNKRYRDLKDRPFKGYFKSPSPTYILVEWALDGGAGCILTGMMVRKKSVHSDDDSEDELDIINFIYEYGKDNKYDIRNFPLVEEKEKIKRIKSYTSAKSLFEHLKKDTSTTFNYFDMSVSSQIRNYFNNLQEYKINHKEWESIIKKINMRESGLSELFQDAKNVNGLVEKWFIKTVEDKLNREENKVKNFGEIIRKYIYQYRDNQSKIEKKESIKEFEICANDILKSAKDFLESKNNSEGLKNKISNLIKFLENNLSLEEKKREEFYNIILDIENAISEIKYEETSLKVYELKDEAADLIKKKEEKEDNLSLVSNDIEVFEKKKHILECAKIYAEYVKASKDVQKYENQIEILNEENKDLEPERQDIGFTLRKYYESKDKEICSSIKINEGNIKNLRVDIEKIKKGIEEINKKLQENSIVNGKLQNNIESFSRKEDDFNKRYNKNCARSITGYYAENFIHSTLLEYEDYLKKKEKMVIEKKKLYEEKLLEIKRMERQREDFVKETSSINNEFNNMRKQQRLFKEEIENRKKIIKYVNIEEDKLFNSEYIINEFISKIKYLKEEENKLRTKLDKAKDEKRKLQTGRTLEIPKEMENKLRLKDINIIYGIDWLKKNNYSEEQNIKLIENNPFLPYCLIMEKEDLIKFKKEDLGLFTSYPIPIIQRDSLTSKINKKMNSLCSLDEITFYVAFNNKLINEDELKNLLCEKERDINALEESLDIKKKEIEFYDDKKNIIRFSKLNKKSYEKLQKDIILKEEELKTKESELEKLRENIKDTNILIDKTAKFIRTKENELSVFRREIEDFNILVKNYEIYTLDKEKLNIITKDIEELNRSKNNKEKELINLEKTLINFEDANRDLKENMRKNRERLNKYMQHNEGNIIQKDIEDLEARYISLSKKISSDIDLLEENLKDANERLKIKEEDLIFKGEEYELNENEYRDVNYDRFMEEEIRRKISISVHGKENLKNNINKLEINLVKIKSDIENLYEKIKENFNKDIPKQRQDIINKDFSKRIFEKKCELENFKKEKDRCEIIIDKIKRNLSNLEEFKDFDITEEIKIDVSFQDLNKYRGELQRDYRNSLDEESKKRVVLSNEINRVARKPMFLNDDFFKKSLETIERVVNEPNVVIENLTITLEAHKALMEKLQADIDVITKEKENVCQSIYEYILEVHSNIGQIDNNSSIKIRDKYIKMLNIKLPDWESNTELYKIRVNDFIDSLTMKAIERLQNNENIEELISKNINTRDLYNEVVSISNIDVKLYKIEEDKQIQISWDAVAQNSGGEGFLSAFVILSSLLSYMRRDETDIFAGSEDGKVIIMDNPFAQTSSEHLLKPLMDIAKKSNTQLICLSGLGGDSIYNRFDNIYVLNLMPSKLKSGLKYLKSDHVKGEEIVEKLVSSRFKIEETVVEQMELF